jgi:hypothetical protein
MCNFTPYRFPNCHCSVITTLMCQIDSHGRNLREPQAGSLTEARRDLRPVQESAGASWSREG